MSELKDALGDLVTANNILGHEGVLDAFGHVSIRHPDDPQRFFMSRARAPEIVEEADILEFHLDGTPVAEGGPPAYIERFIHGAAYEARPDVHAVCHNHTASILPFSISTTPQLRAVIHLAGFMGGPVPIWDIADEFGTETDLLVRTMDQGRSLARVLGDGRLALMRGHGSVVVAIDVVQLVANSIAMDKNARVQLDALSLGGIVPLSEGEVANIAAKAAAPRAGSAHDSRDWELWKRHAGR